MRQSDPSIGDTPATIPSFMPCLAWTPRPESISHTGQRYALKPAANLAIGVGFGAFSQESGQSLFSMPNLILSQRLKNVTTHIIIVSTDFGSYSCMGLLRNVSTSSRRNSSANFLGTMLRNLVSECRFDWTILCGRLASSRLAR